MGSATHGTELSIVNASLYKLTMPLAALEAPRLPMQFPAARAHDPAVQARAPLTSAYLSRATDCVRTSPGGNDSSNCPAVKAPGAVPRGFIFIVRAELCLETPVAVAAGARAFAGLCALAREARGAPVFPPATVTYPGAIQGHALRAHERRTLTSGRPSAQRCCYGGTP